MPLRLDEFERLIAPFLSGDDAASQNTLARRLGMDHSTLSRWRDGKGASYAQVREVAAKLGVSPQRLWSGTIPRRYTADADVRATVSGAPAPSRDPTFVAGALWAIEEMAAQIQLTAKRAREALVSSEHPSMETR